MSQQLNNPPAEGGYIFPSLSEIKHLVETDQEFISCVDSFISNYLQIRQFYNIKQDFDKEVNRFDLEHLLDFVENDEFDNAYKYISRYLNNGNIGKPVKDCIASLLQVHLIHEIANKNVGASEKVMGRINEFVKIFHIENAGYHTRVKAIHTAFKLKHSDVVDAKDRFINYHRQHFLQPMSSPIIANNSPIPKSKPNQSRTDESVEENSTRASSSQSASKEIDEEFEELGGSETYIDEQPPIVQSQIDSQPNANPSQNFSTSPTVQTTDRNLTNHNILDNSKTPKRKAITTSLAEESPQKKCKPYQYDDDIVIMKEENFEITPTAKRVPEFATCIDSLVGCITVKGSTFIFYNTNQICYAKLNKNSDGIYELDESKIKDYKSLELEKKNLSNGNLYLHAFGLYALVGDTFIPKFTLLDVAQKPKVTLEFSDFSFQKIRSFTPSTIDKNIWYLSSDHGRITCVAFSTTARAISEKLFDTSIYKIKSVKLDDKKECLIMLGETTVKYMYIDIVETEKDKHKPIFKKTDEFVFPCMATSNSSHINIQELDLGKVLIQNSGCIFIFNVCTEKIELVADLTARKTKPQILHSMVDKHFILFVEYNTQKKISIINKIDTDDHFKVVSRIEIGKKVVFMHKYAEQYLLIFGNSVGLCTV